MSQQHHEVAWLALKGADIPKKAHEWTWEAYHLKLAGGTFGPFSRCHDIPAAKASRRNAPSGRLFQQEAAVRRTFSVLPGHSCGRRCSLFCLSGTHVGYRQLQHVHSLSFC